MKIMKTISPQSIIVFVTSVVLSSLNGIPPALGQAASGPPPAPSFMKQAGQVLFDRAQKGVLNQINQKLQGTPTQPRPAGQQPANTGPMPITNYTPSSAQQAAPCRSWIMPGEKPIACLLCIHGLGLQSNSYEFFGTEQSRRGLAVYSIDVRGFGSWMQAGGKSKVDFNQSLEDIKQTLQSIRAAYPGVPVYVLGESMGGAVALRAASMYPDLIDGLISSVPAGERFHQEQTSAKVFLNLLSGMNIMDVGSGIINQATQNIKLKSQWQGDPLARLNLQPADLIQFQDFMNSNHDAARKVSTMPVLFVQGNGDQLVKPEGTWQLFNAVASKDKSFFAVPGEHLIFEEAQTQEAGTRDQNFRVINSWLSAKVGHRSRWSGGTAGGGPPGVGYGSRAMSQLNIQGLEQQSQLIDSGQYAAAISQLEQLSAQRPNDPNVLGLLGKAYYKSGQPDKAGTLFRSAMRLRREAAGTAGAVADQSQAQSFNAYLLSLLGGAAPGVLGTSNLRFAPAAKGKVYAFYANWADQCKGINPAMSQLATAFGDRVDIGVVDIENPSFDALVEQFKVGPIPTVVFVAPNGQVSSTIIGESTYANYEAAVRKMIQ